MKYRDLDYAVHAYLKVCEAAGNYTTSAQHKAGSEYFSRNQLEQMWKDRFQDHRDAGKVVYASKTDIKSAFRILGLSPGSWKWLIMKAQDPRTGEWKYFVDKCLPFGVSISCALFQKFSDALCHIFEYGCGYLNFLGRAIFPGRTFTRRMYAKFSEVINQRGAPGNSQQYKFKQHYHV